MTRRKWLKEVEREVGCAVAEEFGVEVAKGDSVEEESCASHSPISGNLGRSMNGTVDVQLFR